MFINDTAIQILKAKGYKDASVKTINYNIQRIFRDVFPGKEYNSLRFNKDAQKIIDKLQTYPEKQQKQYIYAVKLIYDNLDQKFKTETVTKLYNDYYEQVSENYTNLLTMQQPTGQQVARFVTLDEINQVYDHYKTIYEVNKITGDENYSDDMKYLIISLYTYIPPVRPQTYYNTTFEEYQDQYPELNIIDLDTKTILIKSGKTLKAGKVSILPIPMNVIELIEYIKNKYNTKYLLTKLGNVNEPLSHQNFSSIFSRMFFDVIGREISPNNIRNSFVSNLIDTVGLETTPERKRIAKILGHSINTQNNVYSKYSNRIHGK
jgi:integrase